MIFRSDKYIETGRLNTSMEVWKNGSMEVIGLKFANKLLNSTSILPFFHTSILFKVNLDRLVKQMVLEALIGKILEPEQAGGIAFIDGDFQVIGGIKNGQFFSLRHVGIGFADPVDDFISFKNDSETPAPALGLKFIPGNIHNHIFEFVDKDDLSFNIIISQQRPEFIFLNIIYFRIAQGFR